MVNTLLCIGRAAALLAGFAWVSASGGEPSALSSDTPARFKQVTETFDYTKREELIPMRDGVKLKTFILVPKNARHAPMLLARTPYDAAEAIARFQSPRLTSVVPAMLETAAAADYIIVVQDVRGKYGSEGDYVMARPLKGPLNPTDVDHSTDTYDTIDWLVKNVHESNGRVGTIGGSYGGFTALMSLVHPHPALKVAVPFAPAVDTWIGDDDFHNGAFRQAYSLEYIYEQEATRRSDEKWWSGTYDEYDSYLRAGSAGAMAASHGMEQLGYWRNVSQHPAYDAYWQNQALDKILAKAPLTVPVLIVCGLFDQEDIYGGPAVFKALAPLDPGAQFVHLVLGPWSHEQGRGEGRGIGLIQFEGDTALWFRRQVMQPFLDQYLKGGPRTDVPRALVYETGIDTWHRYDAWPRSCNEGCLEKSRALYLLADGKLGFTTRDAGSALYDEYVSDPDKPVPYRERPIPAPYSPDSTWGNWLVDDQRQAASRPDVLVYETEPLHEPLRVAGQPVADLYASTSGTDSDWVVKLIDVWPDEVPDHPKLGGYQQLLSADVFRGRYREDLAHPHPLKPNAALAYRIQLPNVSHVFLPGHRVMVQVQSSWFPLYDRNPQTYVENIFFANPGDYHKASQRIWHAPGKMSAIELPVISQN